MSIASELNALNGYILGAYDEINTKGGTVPANKNMANLASAIGSISTGSPTTITPLSVTENGTYTAPTGTAYSPVTVTVSGGATDNNWAEVMRHESTELFDNTITELYRSVLYTNNGDAYITSMSFPSLTNLGSHAFYGQSKMVSINIPALTDLTGNYLFYFCSKLGSITLPALSHTSSSYYALEYLFSTCRAIQKIDLGNNSTTFNNRFDRYCFNGCTKLKALILRWNNVVINSASNNLTSSGIASGTGYIYVPSSLVSSYQAASNWSTYSSQIRAIEDYSSDGTVNGDINV